MITYIAGKITGNPAYKSEFERAEQRLTERGDIVLNPAFMPKDIPNGKAMPICMAMIEQADKIYLLKGWTASAGARAEWTYAVYLGKEIEEE